MSDEADTPSTEETRNVLVITETSTTVYELDDVDQMALDEYGAHYLTSGLDGEDLAAYSDRNDGTPHNSDREFYVVSRRDAGRIMDRPPVPATGPTQFISQARRLVSQSAGLMARARYLEGDIDVVDPIMRNLNTIGDRLRIEQNRMNGLDSNARMFTEGVTP
jgi:hypothetical protein